MSQDIGMALNLQCGLGPLLTGLVVLVSVSVLCDRPSVTTAVMTSRAFDIRRPCRLGHSYVVRHPIRMS
jgi:hypothetical protein